LYIYYFVLEYDGKKLTAITKEGLQLGDEDDDEKKKLEED
jgi:hypothetical protein